MQTNLIASLLSRTALSLSRTKGTASWQVLSNMDPAFILVLISWNHEKLIFIGIKVWPLQSIKLHQMCWLGECATSSLACVKSSVGVAGRSDFRESSLFFPQSEYLLLIKQVQTGERDHPCLENLMKNIQMTLDYSDNYCNCLLYTTIKQTLMHRKYIWTFLKICSNSTPKVFQYLNNPLTASRAQWLKHQLPIDNLRNSS